MNNSALKFTFPAVLLYVTIYKFFHYGSIKIFDSVNLETINICNRRCEFCPLVYYKKDFAIMDGRLFSKIIDELSNIDFCGRISLHSYNEPLMDKRVVNLIKEVREKCPKSFIVIYSNGDLINLKLFREMVSAGMDILHIMQYDNELNDKIKFLAKSIKNKSEGKHLRIKVFDKNKIVNRAGALEFKKIKNPLNKVCYLPSRQLIISAKGSILLCCNDYFEKQVMGDCQKESIIDVWFNKCFKNIRKKLNKGGRKDLEVCQSCDYQESTQAKIEHKIFNYRNIPMLKLYEKIIFGK